MLEIALSTDSRYLPHAATTIHSAISNGGDVAFHLLHGSGLSAADADVLRRGVERDGATITFHELDDERTRGLPAWNYISKEMWFRLFLGELLPDSERVLYLDADTIVMDSLEPLAELDLGNVYVGAVRNLFLPEHADRPQRLGVPADQAYFNSGVLLLNLEAIRRDDCQRDLLALAQSGDERLVFPDQDALNLVLGRRMRELHPRWNAMNSLLVFPWAADVFSPEMLEETRDRPAIRHFEGPGVSKPWHFLYAFPHRDAYLEHRRATPWPRVRLEGFTPRNALVRIDRRLRGAGPWPPPGVRS